VPPFVAFLQPPADPVGKGIGHFLTAMRIDAFRDLDEYYTGIDSWITRFKATEPIDSAEPVLIHGELELREYRLRKKNGIPINRKVVADMEALAEKFKITL
jgi:LDH2 family malate/lactate/ureidoglycolate dehydrogenase